MPNSVRTKYIQNQIIKYAILIVVILFIVGILDLYATIKRYGTNAIEISQSIAYGVEPEYLSNYDEIKSDSDKYRQIKDELIFIGRRFDGIVDIYVMAPIDKYSFACIYDETSPEAISLKGELESDKLGEIRAYAEAGYNSAKTIYDADADYPVYEVNSGKNKNLLTGYAAVEDEDGHVKVIIATSYSMKKVYMDVAFYLLMLFGFLVVAGIVLIWADVFIAGKKALNSFDDCVNKIVEAVNETSDKDADKFIVEEYKTIGTFISEFVDHYKDCYANNDKLSKMLEESHIRNEMEATVQSEMMDRTLVRNYDNDHISVYGDIYYKNDYSGDFYDVYKLPDGKYIFSMSSIMERNTIAFTCMLYAKLLTREYAMSGMYPDEVLDITNNKLVPGNDAALFVRSVIVEYDSSLKKIYYSSAAGITPILIKKDGNITTLQTTHTDSMPLGAWEDAPYELCEENVEAGDIILFYNRYISYDKKKSAVYKIEEAADIVRAALNEGENVVKSIISQIEKLIGEDDFEYSILVIRIK